MTVNIEQIEAAIARFIDNNLAPKADGFSKFMIYLVAPSIYKQLPKKLDELKQSGMFSDFIDEQGKIKIDELYNSAKEAMKKSGKVLIPKINYFADESDLDILYNYIKNT